MRGHIEHAKKLKKKKKTSFKLSKNLQKITGSVVGLCTFWLSTHIVD